MEQEPKLPDVKVDQSSNAPVKVIKAADLQMLSTKLASLFEQYRSDRRIAELKWLRNLRQYLGIYDPEIEKDLSSSRSKAYPKLTRVKCISTLSRVMNLMFPGNERNWELKASPSPEMSPQDVMQAIQQMQQADQGAGAPPQQPPPEMGHNGGPPMMGQPAPPPQLTNEMVKSAVQQMADSRAKDLVIMIDDQLQELGGDQTLDYIALNRSVVKSGIMYGAGVLRGPFAREVKKTEWQLGQDGQPSAKTVTGYKPQFDFLPVWDFYPDMSAKSMAKMDGWFVRMVMSRSQVRKLADRSDFFGDQVKNALKMLPTGNYKAQAFETELRSMGTKINVNEQKAETSKYEIIIWEGPVSGQMLQMVGVEVAEDKLADDLDAEVWMIGDTVIKADINPWRKLGVDVKTIHTFLFDEDDTSPIGNGLPNVMRDSQMSVAAATRMLLDNASVVCGPNIEVNTDLLRADQDISSVTAYKVWYREGTGPDAQFPAVRNVPIDSHMEELLKTIDLFMKFADLETFVGPATGGDQSRMPSEPMRTAAGASMLRGDAALPFKDIIRNFDSFTQSVIESLVQFNRKFNPNKAQEGDYNVIARGATSLIAKEVRGMQVDQLATTLSPEEKFHVDKRKFVEARFATRDMVDMLVSPEEAERNEAAAGQQQQKQQDQQDKLAEANIRKLLSDAVKNMAQSQKNSANADAVTVSSALDILEKALSGTEQPAAAATNH